MPRFDVEPVTETRTFHAGSLVVPVAQRLSKVALNLLEPHAPDSFARWGFFNAIFAKNFDQISWFPTFVLTPLIYLGGVFYSVSLLPEWAERLSYLNPILYMVNTFRHGFLGTSDVNPAFAFAIMLGFAAAMYAVVVYLMNRGTGIRE